MLWLYLWELLANESLAKGPASGDNIVGEESASVAGGYLKGEALAVKIWVALPVLAPVPGHGLPIGARAFDGNCVDIPRSPNVGD